VDDDAPRAAVPGQVLDEPLEILRGEAHPGGLGRPCLRAGRVLGDDHLDRDQRRLVPVGERRGPPNGAVGALRTVGGDRDAADAARPSDRPAPSARPARCTRPAQSSARPRAVASLILPLHDRAIMPSLYAMTTATTGTAARASSPLATGRRPRRIQRFVV